MKLCMTRTRCIGLLLIVLSGAISILWGVALGRTVPGGPLDFQGLYYGTQCLIQHHNPYSQSELGAVYKAGGGERPSDTIQRRQVVTLYVNLPTTFLFIAPFAMLPLGTAQTLWLILLIGVCFLAAFLMWDIGASYAPGASLFLICLVLADSELIFASGNTAGIVVGFCLVSVWCFLKHRFVPAGVICMAVCLAIKPHDAGLVWLYFLLAGGVYRKRALQSLVVTVGLGLASVLWLSQAAPHWMQNWGSNLAAISAPGGLNEPGLASVTGHSAGMVIDLQAALSVFWSDPRIYNSASYLVCGALLLVWSVRTLRSRFSQHGAHLALAAVVSFTMLVTYHRPYDAKLLLLTVPACAMLWTERGPIRWLALLLNTAAVLLTGDVPLATLAILTNSLHGYTAGIFGHILTVVVMRPVPLILLALGIFYLWVYVRDAVPDTSEAQYNRTAGWMQPAQLSSAASASRGSCSSSTSRF